MLQNLFNNFRQICFKAENEISIIFIEKF